MFIVNACHVVHVNITFQTCSLLPMGRELHVQYEFERQVRVHIVSALERDV